MAKGFQIYSYEYTNTLREFIFCTGQSGSAGNAVCVSGTAGYITNATANCDEVVGVLAQDVASHNTVGPKCKVYHPFNTFLVNRKSGETAGITGDIFELVHFEDKRTVDFSSTNGATSQVRVLRIVDTAAAGECIVTFRNGTTIYG